MAEGEVIRRLAAVVAADVAGYSRLMAADEEGTLSALRSHRSEVIDPMIADHHGRIANTAGDSIVSEFPSVVEALRCAVDVQRAIARRNAGVAEDRRIQFRVGINLGDIIVTQDDIHGDGVNIAARLESLAEPGGVCVSGTAYDQVKNKPDFAFEDLGLKPVKNIPEPVRVFKLLSTFDAAARPRPTGSGESQGESKDSPSIAVLPFANMSGDPEQEYFSDGITEDIITDLSKISGLHVASRNSAFVYKNVRVHAEQFAADLHVRYVLEGSVRKSENNVRITAQLVDASTGGHLWAERYDRELIDIFRLQDEIAGNIVEALKVAISPKEEQAIERRPTNSVEAYQYYLRGRTFLREMTLKSIELAQQMFGEAIRIDPQYAQAYAGLANCASMLAYHHDAGPDAADSAVTNSRKALALDPSLAEAHACRGRIHAVMGEEQAASREFEAATRLDPNLYEAYFYWGLLHTNSGKFEGAVPLLQRASALADDEDLQVAMMLNAAYRGMGRLEELRESAKRTFEIAQKRIGINPEDERAAYVGAMALTELGDLERARRWARMAAALQPGDGRATYNLACLFSLLGDVDQAMSYLERTLELGCSPRKRRWMRNDPDLVNLRKVPRFHALLDKFDR